MLNLVDGQWITSRVRDAVAGWTETHKIVDVGNSDVLIAAERVLVMTVDDVFPVDLQSEPASLTRVVITLLSQGNHFRISRLEFAGSVLLDTFLGLMVVELAALFLAPELPTRLLPPHGAIDTEHLRHMSFSEKSECFAILLPALFCPFE